MSAAKLVGLTTILYLILALQSVLGQGVFLPFLPLKEVLLGVMALLLAILNFKKDLKPYLYLFLLGLSYLLFSDMTLEVFLNTEERLHWNHEFAPFVDLGKLLLFSILFLYLSLERDGNKIRLNALPILTWVGVLCFNIFGLKEWEELLMIPLAIALYIQYYKAEEEQIEADKYHAIKLFFIAYAALGCIDLLGIYLNK